MTAVRDLLALIDARGERTEESRSAPSYALRLAELLLETYPDVPILVGPDGPFPVAVLPLSPAAIDDVDRLSVSLAGPDRAPAVLDRDMLETLRRRGADIWDGRTFSLSSLALDSLGRVDGLHGFVGSFFDMVASAGYLEVELLAALLRSDRPPSLDELPARRAVLAGFRSPAECLASGGGIAAVVAVSTLLVYARERRYWALYELRAPAAAGFRFRYHVVPALIYQPVTPATEVNLARERSVVHNVEREYLEELFGLPEVERSGGAAEPDFFYDHPNLAFLRELRASGAARLLGTGLIFNLLNHRPEICTVLLVEDESWYLAQRERHPRPGALRALRLDERLVPATRHPDAADDERVGTLALADERWREMARPWLMTPSGAAALILGAQLAVGRLGLDSPPWLRGFHIAPPRGG